MIEIDGAAGEGGGQILRTSLSLSAVTGKPFAIRNIRAGRSKPDAPASDGGEGCRRDLRRGVEGADVGSQTLVFWPGTVKPGDYVFRIGSAGSTSLVLQTILPPLALAAAPSNIVIKGGTHNTGAPPFDFLDRSFLPLLRRMGFIISMRMNKPDFYPAGGGVIDVTISATGPFVPLSWRNARRNCRACRGDDRQSAGQHRRARACGGRWLARLASKGAVHSYPQRGGRPRRLPDADHELQPGLRSGDRVRPDRRVERGSGGGSDKGGACLSR